MMEGGQTRQRLMLVTPPAIDRARFSAQLAEALSAGDVAAVLIASGAGETERQDAAEALVGMVQDHGAAAIVLDHTRVAGRTRADGVQIETGFDDLRAACERIQPKGIVGAGRCLTRDAAMQAGELGIDYLFLGRPHGDTHPEPHPKALALAEWWTEMTQVPAVMMAGHDVASVAPAAATGAEFVALHRAIWEHPAGPAEAVRLADGLLRQRSEAA